MVRDQERADRMAAMYRQGLTLEAIGAQFGITRERVRQILRKIGVDASDGGQAARIRLIGGPATERKRQAARAKQEAIHGVPYALLQELRRNGATRAYQYQRASAQLRGVPFGLTLGEWWAIWQASGKWDQRGRGLNGYCMSRVGDSGGYVLGNVHIQPTQQNSRDAVAKWRGKTKEFPGVFCLYPGRDRAWLARVGKVRLGYFRSAEEANAARIAYMEANPESVKRSRGWFLRKGALSKPYVMQCAGFKAKAFATQAEAEAAYAECVAIREAARRNQQTEPA